MRGRNRRVNRAAQNLSRQDVGNLAGLPQGSGARRRAVRGGSGSSGG